MTQVPQFDPLLAFAYWFIQQPISFIRPPILGVYDFGDITSLVLYRQGQFQVELFIVRPNHKGFPDHTHPNVDAMEAALSGKIFFTRDGVRLTDDTSVNIPAPDGASQLCGNLVRVREGQIHGASVGPEGASFLSIQHWLNGVRPTSVGPDWEGPGHGEEFKKSYRGQNLLEVSR